MTATQIVELIKQKDWTFTEEPTQIDVSAAPALITLSKDPDPEIRELTLFALNGIAGPGARACILEALHDEDMNVRSAASSFLLARYTKGDLETLCAEISSNSDEAVREQVALTLGKSGEAISKTRIKAQAEVETDADAAHAMHLALVRLQDAENLERYIARLGDTDPKKRVQAIQDFAYIQDRALLKHFAGLLQDGQPGHDVGPSNKKIMIRVCDVAVNVLDKALDHPFSFAIDEFKAYTPDELRQAVAIVKRMR